MADVSDGTVPGGGVSFRMPFEWNDVSSVVSRATGEDLFEGLESSKVSASLLNLAKPKVSSEEPNGTMERSLLTELANIPDIIA